MTCEIVRRRKIDPSIQQHAEARRAACGIHAARHTYASFALVSGKSVRWTVDPLGHASPMLTLKTYAHAMREEETDLSFADFGGPGRPYTAPVFDAASEDENAPGPSDRGRWKFLERETGFEPATLTLAT